jgi:hypothetical protein
MSKLKGVRWTGHVVHMDRIEYVQHSSHKSRSDYLEQIGVDKTSWPESASELYRPSYRHLSAKLVQTFASRGFRVVSVTDLYGRILSFSRPE